MYSISYHILFSETSFKYRENGDKGLLSLRNVQCAIRNSRKSTELLWVWTNDGSNYFLPTSRSFSRVDLRLEDVHLGRRSDRGDRHPSSYIDHRSADVCGQRGMGALGHSGMGGGRKAGWHWHRLCLVRGHAPTTSFPAGVDRAAAGVGSGPGQRLRVHHSIWGRWVQCSPFPLRQVGTVFTVLSEAGGYNVYHSLWGRWVQCLPFPLRQVSTVFTVLSKAGEYSVHYFLWGSGVQYSAFPLKLIGTVFTIPSQAGSHMVWPFPFRKIGTVFAVLSEAGRIITERKQV